MMLDSINHPGGVFEYKLEKFDRDKAKMWLEAYRYDRQRGKKKDKIQQYARDMQEGNFNCVQPIHVALYNDMKLLVNGLQRLNAVVLADAVVYLYVKYVRCNSMKAVGDLYASLDTGSIRNDTDIIRAKGIHETIRLTSAYTKRLKAAIHLIYNIFRPFDYSNKMSATEMEKACIEWGSYIHPYVDIIENHALSYNKNLLKTRGVMAVALLNFRYCYNRIGRPDPVAFWKKVADNSGLPRNDPAFTCVGTLNRTGKTRDQDIQAKICAIAWNSYTRGNTLQTISHFTEEYEVEILYTSLDNRHNMTIPSRTKRR